MIFKQFEVVWTPRDAQKSFLRRLKHVLLSCNISISSFLLAIIGSFGNLAKRSNAEDAAAEKKKKQGQDKRPRQQQQQTL